MLVAKILFVAVQQSPTPNRKKSILVQAKVAERISAHKNTLQYLFRREAVSIGLAHLRCERTLFLFSAFFFSRFVFMTIPSLFTDTVDAAQVYFCIFN